MDWVYLGSVAGAAAVAFFGGMCAGFSHAHEKASAYWMAWFKAKHDETLSLYREKVDEYRAEYAEKHRASIAELEQQMRKLRADSNEHAAQQVIRMGEAMMQHVPQHLHARYRTAMQIWRDEYLKGDTGVQS